VDAVFGAHAGDPSALAVPSAQGRHRTDIWEGANELGGHGAHAALPGTAADPARHVTGATVPRAQD
jgi:hypothetical protein